MNTITEINKAFLPHVSLIPPVVICANHRRHPIFWRNKKHIRKVRCELVADPCSDILKTEYSDKRTYKTFPNKESAERYLGEKIPQLEHEGELCVEKVIKVNACYICKKCAHVGCSKIDMVFRGPLNLVSGPITITDNQNCPNCKKASVQIDISTEPCPDHPSPEDCEWA